ncbi:YfjI family protein [Catenulispora sp. MAP12-49]|uniref:YfjI family protein n=1 Tax=Catenulispora sp. MAP12-49 TaxID=3156302 RepID=UPI0035115960
MVEAAAEQFQVPVDLAAMTALGIISASVGGRRRIKVRPGWDETTSLWVAGLAGSSELKSPLIRKLSAPIRDAEKALQIERKDEIEELEQDRRIAESQMKAAEARAGTAKTENARKEATADAKAARQRLAEIGQVPKPPRIIFGDLTPEIAAKRCAEQGGRIAIISAEGGTLEMMSGGYSKDQPNINFFLNAYSGDSEPVDRITRETILSDEAHVAMALLFQPAVLDGLARKHGKLQGKGLFGRYLYTLPVSRVGSRIESADPVPANVDNAYARRIEDLIDKVWDSDSDTIEFTTEAAKVLATYRASIEPRLGPQGDLRGIGEWAGKLAGNCARVAALLALFDNPGCREIDDKHVNKAVNLGPYLIAHAKRIYELMGRKEEDETLDVARDALAWIRHRTNPLQDFTKRDMQRGLSRRIASADQVQDALDLLAEAGWVAVQPAPERAEGQGGRPPSPRYDVHPWCAETR